MSARIKRDTKIPTPEEQVRQKIRQLIKDEVIDADAETFENCTIGELLETLTSLPNWDEIKSTLADATIEESEEENHRIKF
jgi:hypothetical protein